MGLLQLSDGTFTSLKVLDSGMRLGGWLLNIADNHFRTPGRFTGGRSDELLVTSLWRLRLPTLSEGRLASVVMAPNGASYGQPRVNTLDSPFAPVGDLDGDGRPELLVVSPWGMGILEVAGSSLACPWLAPNGSRFGGWLLNTADKSVDAVVDLDGDGRDEIVLTGPLGMGVLRWSGTAMDGLRLAAIGTRFRGGWALNTADDDVGIGQCLLRMHVKILTTPTSVPLDTMIAQLQRVFDLQGIRVQRVSTENLTLPLLDDVVVGSCAGTPTAEQELLFGNRAFAGPGNIVLYFVRSTVPSNNGCATHPAGRPGAVVARTASPWDARARGGSRPRAPACGRSAAARSRRSTSPTRLNDDGSQDMERDKPTADLVTIEVIALRHSRLTHDL